MVQKIGEWNQICVVVLHAKHASVEVGIGSVKGLSVEAFCRLEELNMARENCLKERPLFINNFFCLCAVRSQVVVSRF